MKIIIPINSYLRILTSKFHLNNNIYKAKINIIHYYCNICFEQFENNYKLNKHNKTKCTFIKNITLFDLLPIEILLYFIKLNIIYSPKSLKHLFIILNKRNQIQIYDYYKDKFWGYYISIYIITPYNILSGINLSNIYCYYCGEIYSRNDSFYCLICKKNIIKPFIINYYNHFYNIIKNEKNNPFLFRFYKNPQLLTLPAININPINKILHYNFSEYYIKCYNKNCLNQLLIIPINYNTSWIINYIFDRHYSICKNPKAKLEYIRLMRYFCRCLNINECNCICLCTAIMACVTFNQPLYCMIHDFNVYYKYILKHGYIVNIINDLKNHF